MTEIQKANIAVANFIIDELYKDKPFVIQLDDLQNEALRSITDEVRHSDRTWHAIWSRTKRAKETHRAMELYIDERNVDKLYHMLSSYVAKHDQYGVVRSLGEVS